MQCVGTETLTGKQNNVTLEHISGDTQALTLKYQEKKCSPPVSSVRKAIKLNHLSKKRWQAFYPSAKDFSCACRDAVADAGMPIKKYRGDGAIRTSQSMLLMSMSHVSALLVYFTVTPTLPCFSSPVHLIHHEIRTNLASISHTTCNPEQTCSKRRQETASSE